MSEPSRHRTLRIPARLDDAAQAKAAELDRSVTWVILRSLEIALEGEEEARARSLLRAWPEVRR